MQKQNAQSYLPETDQALLSHHMHNLRASGAMVKMSKYKSYHRTLCQHSLATNIQIFIYRCEKIWKKTYCRKLVFTSCDRHGLDSGSRQRTEAQSSGTECQHQDLTKTTTTSWRYEVFRLTRWTSGLRCALLRPFSIWSVRSFSSWRKMCNL